MNKRVKAFFAAFGGLLIIWPSANYGQSLTGNTVEKRSKATWERVGLHLRSSMNSYDKKAKATRRN